MFLTTPRHLKRRCRVPISRINWDQISRAADGMISNHGKDALAEAERRAQTLRLAGCYSAVAWENICEVIQDRIGRYTRSECTIAPKLSQPDKLRGVEATGEGVFPFR